MQILPLGKLVVCCSGVHTLTIRSMKYFTLVNKINQLCVDKVYKLDLERKTKLGRFACDRGPSHLVFKAGFKDQVGATSQSHKGPGRGQSSIQTLGLTRIEVI